MGDSFNNVGVGASTGPTPYTIEAMADDATAFLDALSFPTVDLLGFSIGSFVAQEIVLIRPELLQPGAGIIRAAGCGRDARLGRDVIGAVGPPETIPPAYLSVFFAPPTRAAPAAAAAGRMFAGTCDQDEPPAWQTRQAQYDAVCAWGGRITRC